MVDFAQLQLDFSAASGRSMLQSSTATTMDMLNVQRVKNPSIKEFCLNISDECVGITPDFLILLLESRELLLRFITKDKGQES